MPRKRDPNKPKKTFWDRYKTYDPKVEGFGSEEEWKQSFKTRVGSGSTTSSTFKTFKSSKKSKGKHELTAREILGVSKDATLSEVKRAFLKSKKHPDQGGSAEEFRELYEAYLMVKEEFK